MQPAIILTLAVGMGLPGFGQRPNPSVTSGDAVSVSADSSSSSTGAHPISIFAVVADKRTGPVQNLTRDDFQIQADKKPQTVRDFSLARELPLTVGIIVNASPAQRDALEEERTATVAFFSDLLSDPAKYKAFVIQFARDVDLLQDVTGSREPLRAALRQLETDRASRVEAVDTGTPDTRTGSPAGRYPGRGSDGSGKQPAEQKRANNALYDALYLSSDEITRKQTGRKVLIVLSDGDDSGSKESLSSAIEAAQRADTVIYAVYYKERRQSESGFSMGQPDYCDDMGGGYPGGYPDQCAPRLPETAGRPDGRKTLERICTETGGRMFEASKKEPLADIYKEIASELNAQYRISFVPDKDASSDGYHHVLVTVGSKTPSKDLVIQSRDGYYIGD